MVPSPVRKVAESHHKPVLTPDRIRDPASLETIKHWAPQLIVVVAYGQILPRSILDLPPEGCVNVHYSLLPKYRGAAPIPWALLHGEERSGVTTMKLVETMDAGPILLQEEVSIAPDETAASLGTVLNSVGVRLLSETIRRLKEGSIVATPQRAEEATYAPMLKKEDGQIDWTQSAEVIERRVRPFTLGHRHIPFGGGGLSRFVGRRWSTQRRRRLLERWSGQIGGGCGLPLAGGYSAWKWYSWRTGRDCPLQSS